MNKKEFLIKKKELEKETEKDSISSVIYSIDALLESGISIYKHKHRHYGCSYELTWQILEQVKRHYKNLDFEVLIYEKSRTFYEWFHDLYPKRKYTVIELK